MSTGSPPLVKITQHCSSVQPQNWHRCSSDATLSSQSPNQVKHLCCNTENLHTAAVHSALKCRRTCAAAIIGLSAPPQLKWFSAGTFLNRRTAGACKYGTSATFNRAYIFFLSVFVGFFPFISLPLSLISLNPLICQHLQVLHPCSCQSVVLLSNLSTPYTGTLISLVKHA